MAQHRTAPLTLSRVEILALWRTDQRKKKRPVGALSHTTGHLDQAPSTYRKPTKQKKDPPVCICTPRATLAWPHRPLMSRRDNSHRRDSVLIGIALSSLDRNSSSRIQTSGGERQRTARSGADALRDGRGTPTQASTWLDSCASRRASRSLGTASRNIRTLAANDAASGFHVEQTRPW